jgi:hypothetical protein
MKLKIITVATVILLLVAMSVPVYADTTIPAPPSGAWEYWVIANRGSIENPEIYCLSSHGPIKVRSQSDNTMIFNTYKWYEYIDNEWQYWKNGNNTMNLLNDFIIVYASNHDIAYEDGSGFFFECPKVSPLTQTMKGTDFGTILRNFSVGLIPIVGLLILAIALTKGWRFLRGQLMT